MTKVPVVVLLMLSLALAGPPAGARSDSGLLRCESKNYRHTVCGLPDHGYVRLERQLSSTRCVQGRNWDYNWREVWVDDGCAAEFRVERREHSSRHDDKDKASAAVAALAILGAVAVASGSRDHHDDDDRGRVGHASHVPRWMVGDFRAYNEQARAEVLMTVEPDGRVRAKSDGVRLNGYINDGRLYVGDAVFELERTDVGFNTTQVGRWSNRVAYRRH